MLTATDDRSSHIKNSKNKKSYITITLHIVIRQCADHRHILIQFIECSIIACFFQPPCILKMPVASLAPPPFNSNVV